MFDYRYHYAVLATEDRVRSHQQRTPSRDTKRVFRLGDERPSGRSRQR
jgi:hypothetical protein